MKKRLQLAAICLGLTVSTNVFSQRYLTETFSNYTVTPNVMYGTNLSVHTGTGLTTYPLNMDIYEPVGDVATKRPVVIVLHTGSFLPPVYNGQATGSRKDSAIVEMCKHFAKRGYVAVAASYRFGWNPLSSSQDVRTGTLLQAVYRGIQDAKNAVRFLKNDEATANTYKIDSTKIAVGGLGTGGYLALAYGSLNKVAEIQLAKFANLTSGVPYIDQSVMGNFDGTDVTSQNTANYPSRTSNVSMTFNIGGAIGDTTWIEAGEVPIVSLQTTKDPFAPYKSGDVIVPTTNQIVVNASGSYDVQKRVKRLGNNAIFNASVYNDPYTTKANMNNDGMSALYPFVTPAPGAALACGPQTEQGSPWDWWDGATFAAQYNAVTTTTNGAAANCNQLRSNPDMAASKGKLYIDTIQGFLNPRLVCGLALAECANVSVKENVNSNNLTVFPNPATNDVNFTVTGHNNIQKVKIYNATGSLVKSIEGLNTQEYKANIQGLGTGLYFATVELNNSSVVTKKITVQ